MRTTTWRALLGLAFLTASQPALAGVSFGGDLGVSFNRSDQSGGNASSSTTSWWFSGGLHLDASLFTPGTLDLGASASYLGYRTVGGSASDGLNYQLRIGALARTPLSLSASANRSTVDFTSDSNSGRVGSTRTDSYSASAVLATVSYPILTANLRNTTTLTRFSGTPDVNTEVTSVYAEASQSIEALNYSLTYDTNWSSGDYAETNYQNHVAGIRAQAQLATNVTAQVMATYDIRLPTLVNSLNPRYDNQSLSTWVQWTASPGTSGGGGYSYSSGLFDAPGSPLRQSISHSVSAYGSHQLSPAYTVDLNASGSATQSRNGATEQSATGEQAGAGLRWSRQLARFMAQANVNGSLGLYQPSGAPNTRAWGIGAGASLSRPLDSWYGNAGLSGAYDENTGASAGDRTRLLASLGASGSPLGWSFTSLLTGGFSRSNSPSFGKNVQTHLRLDAQANRSGFNLGLNAGITDDLAEVLVPGAPPATLLVPVEFNTQSRYVTGTATVPTFPRLFLTLVGRYLSVSAPGRTDQWESGLSVAASYYVGAFNFSLYDQVTVSGNDSGSTGTQNLLFLSVTRSFGR
jgi:hypothetical protein